MKVITKVTMTGKELLDVVNDHVLSKSGNEGGDVTSSDLEVRIDEETEYEFEVSAI